MNSHDLARKLIADSQYAIRSTINDRFPDDRDVAVYWTIVDVVKLAHGFTTEEAKQFIHILAGEV